MAKKVTSDRLFEPGLFSKQKEEALLFLTVLKDLEQEYKDILKVNRQIITQTDKKTTTGLTARKKAVKEVSFATKELQKIEQQTKRVEAQLNLTSDERNKKLTLMRERLKMANAEERKRAKNLLQSGDAYKRLAADVNKAQANFKRLAAEFGINSKQARKARVALDGVQKELMQVDAAARDGRRNVGRYGSAFSGMGSKLKGIGLQFVALTTLIYGLGRAIASSFRTFRDFQQGTANLAAVLGKSRNQIRPLIDDAKRLGATTAFTASQVTELQVAFSKLGFSEEEILKTTEATLALAAATNTELEEAATVAASTLNAFGLEASQTQRVVDVMAKSFSSSSLDMSKFSTAMATVGPVAKTAGLSIERTTALLGTISDAGIDASTAGTALRNIFLELAKSGMTFEEAMSKIQNSTNKNATSMELFGKRGATVATVLAENTEKADELTGALNNAGGAAQQMADEQLDTLSGATTRLSSAWEGFILALEDGDGVIARVLRSAIDLTTEFIQALTQLTMTAGQLEDSYLGEIGALQTEKQVERQKKIVEFSEAHFSSLQKVVDEGGRYAAVAEEILKLRQQGLSSEEAIFVVNSKTALVASDMLKTSEDKISNDAKEAGLAALTTSELEKQSEHYQAIKDFNKETAITKLQQLSVDQLQNIIASDLEGKIIGMAKWELKRREQLGEITDEMNEQNGSAGDTVKKLTEMQKLQEQLRLIEQERSDELIKNNGVETERFNTLTAEAGVLQNQIDKYQQILDGVNKIEKAQRRESSTGLTSIDDIAVDEEESGTQVGWFNTDMLDFVEDNGEKIIDKEKDLNKQRLEAYREFYNELAQLSTERIDREIENIDKEIQAAQSRQEQLEALAAQGQLTAEQSIASEIRKREELERQREQLEQRKIRRENIARGLDLLAANLQSGQSGDDAVVNSFRQITQLLALLRGLPGFYTGTDNAPEGYAWTDEKGPEIHMDKNGVIKDMGSDGPRVKYLEKGDRILTAQESRIVKSQMNIKPFVDAKEIRMRQEAASSRDNISAGLRSVKDAVEKKPVPGLDYDPLKDAVVKNMESKNAIIREHKSNKPKFM